ncbi:hypothetical protein SNE40_016746 [Patella caerulea]|uniref:Small ribosomal subunit protein eS1 n=1 Tax=Patella caerulea TaxID=87958 RepID=A0AAN8PEI0_PATCE
MAVGKDKRVQKGSRKGGKKKAADPFSKKEWYDVRAPSMFAVRDIGVTPVTRSSGTKLAADSLKGRMFKVSLADLQNDEVTFRKFKLLAEDVQGKNLLTTFQGMELTRDKLCSVVKKWQTMIDSRVDVKTTDGYHLRVFCIGFTKKRPNQVKKTCYAQRQHVFKIRKKMEDIMRKEITAIDMREVINKLIPDSIGKDIEKACQGIFPIHEVYIRKVKILKKPKLDFAKLLEMHGESNAPKAAAPVVVEESGEKIDRPDGYEPPVAKEV